MGRDIENRRELILWLVGGFIVLLVISRAAISYARTVFAPLPIHQLLLVFLSPGPGWDSLVIPLIYASVLGVLWGRESFGLWVLVISIAFAALNFVWLIFAWQQPMFVHPALPPIVTTANVIAFLAIVLTAAWGLVKAMRQLQKAAYFALFVMLSWYAFPYFGELP